MEENKLVKKMPNIVNIMAAKYSLDPEKFKQTIKATVLRPGKDGRVATDEEFMAFLIVAHKYDLDPFTNEIYGYPSKKGGIIPVVGVDGHVRKICNDESFDGMEITFSDENITPEKAKQCPEWCEIKLYRKGVERPIIVREYIDEVYRPAFKNSQGQYLLGPWQTHTKRMLRHKTIIQAGRVAGFMVGVYDEDEAQRIIEAETIDHTKTTKPETIAPTETTPIVDGILTVEQAKTVPAGKVFDVAGNIVSYKADKVGKNKSKDIARYIINDEKDAEILMKISVWGLPMEGLAQKDKVIFQKVIGTLFNNELCYLAETINPDMRGEDETGK